MTNLAAAERLLKSKIIAQTAFQKFSVETLAKLCEAYGMPVRATGQKPMGSKKKSDYIAAIMCFVSLQQTMY
jgi:phage gp29-like protein